MKTNVALALSGGGARGIAHIGAIEELEKQGFNITSISGASMGAVVGGIYAMGKLKEFKDWLYTLDKLKVFKLIDFTFSTQGLIKGDRVFQAMKQFTSDANIEDLNIQYAAVAVDILNKKEVIFTKGSIYNAMRASVAIPTVFTPVKTEHGLLIDGGVLNNIPISHVKRNENDLLIAIDVNAEIPAYKPAITKTEHEAKHSVYIQKMKIFHNHLNEKHPSENNGNLGYFNLINCTISLMVNHIAQIKLEKYPPDILINISKDSSGVYDFYKAEELVEIGRHAAIVALAEYKKVNVV
jgi:NTE family protein